MLRILVVSVLLASWCWAEPRVLYLGEEHDSAADHRRQLEILEEVSPGRSPVVVAEMFQNVSRKVLDEYVAGNLDDEELKLQSEWDKRWGHTWDLYVPIWQLCQQRHIPILPLRNSSESGKNLGKLGVQAFTAEEREGLAPEPYEFGPNPESLRTTFEAHAGKTVGGPRGGASAPPGTLDMDEAFARFLKVQTLWEEYMAAQIRRALRETNGPVIVLVGQGHLTHGHTLPHRVQAQWPHPLKQQVILLPALKE